MLLNILNIAMVDDLFVIATALQCLTTLVNILSSVHIPVLSGGIELLEEDRYVRLTNEINLTITASVLLECFCIQIIIVDNSMPPSKHPKGTYGESTISKFCAFKF